MAAELSIKASLPKYCRFVLFNFCQGSVNRFFNHREIFLPVAVVCNCTIVATVN